MTRLDPAKVENDEKTKVLLIVSHLSPTYGLEKMAIRLADDIKTKFDVSVLSVGSTGNVVIEGVEIKSVGRSRIGFRRFITPFSLLKHANKYNDHVVILVGLWAAIPWLLIRFRGSENTIIWEHSLLSEKYAFDKRLWLLSILARLLYPRALRVIAVSESQNYDLKRQGHVNSTHIYNPLSKIPSSHLTRQQPTTKSNRLNIISVSSLTSIKRHEMTINAIKVLDENSELTIVGDGPLRAELELLAKSLNIQSRINFTGHLHPDRVRALLESADIMVHSSVSETFGLSLIEAAQVGTPVVATGNITTASLIPSIVPGLVVDSNSKSIADGIKRINEDGIDDFNFQTALVLQEEKFSPKNFIHSWTLQIQEASSRIKKPIAARP